MSFLSAILFGLRETISKAKDKIYIPFIIWCHPHLLGKKNPIGFTIPPLHALHLINVMHTWTLVYLLGIIDTKYYIYLANMSNILTKWINNLLEFLNT